MHGVDPLSGEVVDVPLHRHEVTVDIARIQFQLEYTFEEPWAIRWRLPIEQKSRTSAIGSIDPATPEQIEQMERNLQIHHPSQTLMGFGDMEMLLSWHNHDMGKEGSLFSAAAGTTIPLGRTEENPYLAGDSGEEHEHIQFGSGTFDPIIEMFYSLPIGEESSISAYAQGRFPGSRNDEGFRGSQSVQGGIGAITSLGDFGPGEQSFGVLGLLYQDLGRATWDGLIDVNTGYQALSASIGISWKDEEYRNRTLTLILPLSLETPYSSEGTYEPGPVLSFGIGF
mgnify:FL=1|jgi:hypothetical protein